MSGSVVGAKRTLKDGFKTCDLKKSGALNQQMEIVLA